MNAVTFVNRSRWKRRCREIAGITGTRLLVMVPIIGLVSMGVFLLAEYSPFDPLEGYLGSNYERTSAEQRESLGDALVLHENWFPAWKTWVSNVFHGDLGQSRVYSETVGGVIAERLPMTLLLSGVAFCFAVVMGLMLGVLAGLHPGQRLDRSISFFASSVQAVPPYVISLGAVALFAVSLGWFPAGGVALTSDSHDVATLFSHVFLPAVVLALSQMPWLVLALRSSVQHALSTDAVRAAIARGLSRRTVVLGHVLPVSLAPLVTLLGARLPELIVGAVIVEEVFGWPGLAASTVSAARELDFPLLAFLATATTALVLVGSLLSDVVYLLLDPRVRNND